MDTYRFQKGAYFLVSKTVSSERKRNSCITHNQGYNIHLCILFKGKPLSIINTCFFVTMFSPWKYAELCVIVLRRKEFDTASFSDYIHSLFNTKWSQPNYLASTGLQWHQVLSARRRKCISSSTACIQGEPLLKTMSFIPLLPDHSGAKNDEGVKHLAHGLANSSLYPAPPIHKHLAIQTGC